MTLICHNIKTTRQIFKCFLSWWQKISNLSKQGISQVSSGTWQQDIGTVDPFVLWGGTQVRQILSLKVQLDLSWAFFVSVKPCLTDTCGMTGYVIRQVGALRSKWLQYECQNPKYPSKTLKCNDLSLLSTLLVSGFNVVADQCLSEKRLDGRGESPHYLNNTIKGKNRYLLGSCHWSDKHTTWIIKTVLDNCQYLKAFLLSFSSWQYTVHAHPIHKLFHPYEA